MQKSSIKYYAYSLLLILVAFTLLWLNTQVSWQADWSYASRNTLSRASQELLTQMDGPITVQAYFDSTAQTREQLRRFVKRYQRFKQDTHLSFIDTQLDEEELKRQGFTRLGQVKIGYGEKQQLITKLNETTFTSALFRLIRVEPSWVVALQGHGERNPLDEGNNGLSRFTNELKKVGINVQPLNLLEHQLIPDNTKVLLIAGARNQYLPGELQLIADFIDKGGNLLWLREPSVHNQFAAVDDLLGLEMIPGVVIDANVQLRNVLGIKHPAVVPVLQYPAHTITRDISSHSLFPFTSSFVFDSSSGWTAQTFIQSLERSWSEVGDLADVKLAYEQQNGDTQGPLNIGISLERKSENGIQRIVVVGDSDFITNAYLGNGANLTLGVNIVNWLAQDERLISIIPRAAPDQRLELNNKSIMVIAILLFIVIPVLLIATGLIIHWRRNRN
jgi:ABC-type uncharacterized transport system involved in gliding motility auxiliary subunit